MHDGEQYTTLLLRHKETIWKLCRKYAKHDADRCADLVQEVSIALWEHFARLQPDASPLEEKNWVMSNTRLVLRNIHRTKQLEFLPIDKSMEENIADNRDSSREQLKELFDELSDEERWIMQRRYEGYNAKEIGTMMNLSSNAVYQRIIRIIDKLQQISHER